MITRAREKTLDVWNIGTNDSTWYILETNYDHWKLPFVLDDRRSPANHCMKNMTQEVVLRFIDFSNYVILCQLLSVNW